ncbi:DUF3288 family protein [Phormidium sp. LEGE 05292]|uniref:DUF3288 family protein n=1 Tax=[Phormidium] sp. LEGE 05292 TaxID=767427 RepID=UPI00187E4B8C|nr:DUF3288 family protein [Phormidium sp. LEGE 05292]MBE9226217.1 DUF3288 family protein [Phormidium sp. LEGE 05292]
MKNQEQQHPLYKGDREIVDRLLQTDPTDYNMAELARLKIRYRGFPGAKDIQTDLEKVLQKWQMDEEQLFVTTRQIHAKGLVYKTRDNDSEDWA